MEKKKTKQVILAVDIGNTAITLGVVDKTKIKETIKVRSNQPKSDLQDSLKKKLKQMKRSNMSVDKVLICSVVPALTDKIKHLLKQELHVPVRVIGGDINVPIKNRYHKPSQVGIDRLVGAYGVQFLYGSPAIIIDFGTATTIDIVNQKGEYEGGIILPGIRLSVESLYSKTALLPHIESIKPPKDMVGKNTEDSILSGIFYGYGAMCTELIKKLKRRSKGPAQKKNLKYAKVILTGGYTKVMKRYISAKVDTIDEGLVLKSIALLNNPS